MGDTTVDLQAARIERCLQDNSVSARVWQATIAPRFIRFDLTVAAGTKVNRVTALEEELAMSLGVDAVRIDRDAGVIKIEVPRTDAKRLVTLADMDAMFARGRKEGVNQPGTLTAVLGLDEGSLPLMVRIPSPDVAHILIAGTTGSGKTELERTIVTSLVQRNGPGRLALVLLDPKGAKLAPFAGLPHTRLHAIQPAEMVAALAYCVAELDRRQIGALPHILVVIDELADLLQTNPEAAGLLLRLTQVGREYNIHVIAATQRPAAALVGGMVKANFPLRLVGSVVSTDDAKVASGLPGTGAERLLGRGDFLLVAKGNVIRFQAAITGAEQLARLQESGGPSRLGQELQATLRAQALSGVGGWVGGAASAAESGSGKGNGRALAHPPTPPTRRPGLAERFSPDELWQAYLANDRNKRATLLQTFGYKDPAVADILNQAIALHEPQEVLQ